MPPRKYPSFIFSARLPTDLNCHRNLYTCRALFWAASGCRGCLGATRSLRAEGLRDHVRREGHPSAVAHLELSAVFPCANSRRLTEPARVAVRPIPQLDLERAPEGGLAFPSLRKVIRISLQREPFQVRGCLGADQVNQRGLRGLGGKFRGRLTFRDDLGRVIAKAADADGKNARQKDNSSHRPSSTPPSGLLSQWLNPNSSEFSSTHARSSAQSSKPSSRNDFASSMAAVSASRRSGGSASRRSRTSRLIAPNRRSSRIASTFFSPSRTPCFRPSSCQVVVMAFTPRKGSVSSSRLNSCSCASSNLRYLARNPASRCFRKSCSPLWATRCKPCVINSSRRSCGTRIIAARATPRMFSRLA